MKDKKFKLLLVSALGFGQAFSVDMSELDDHLGNLLGEQKSVVSGFGDSASSSNSSNGKKLVDIYVPGSEKKGGKKKPIWSSGVSAYKNKGVVPSFDDSSTVKNNASNQESLKVDDKKDVEISYDFMLNLPGKDPIKIRIDSNSNLAVGKSKIENYLDEEIDLVTKENDLTRKIKIYNNKIKDVEKNQSLYTPMFITHINTKYKSLLDLQKNMSQLGNAIRNDKKFIIDEHFENISSATGIFSSDYATILSNLENINDKLQSIYKNYQELEAAISEVSKDLEIFDQEAVANKQRAEEIRAKKAAKEAAKNAATKAIEYQKAKQLKNQEAIAAAKAAEQQAEQEKRQAEELAKQKEEAAAKAEAALKAKNAELEAMKIDNLIAKMNDLRNRADSVALNLSTLVSDIENNAHKYQDEFVHIVRARIESRIADLQKEFNARIQNINSMITKMQKLDNDFNQVKTQILNEHNLQRIGELDSQINDLLNKYTNQYKTVSSLFDTSEKIYNNLLTVYNEIQETSLNAIIKEVNPKAIAAALDLAKAVRMRQIAMVPRVLQLAYAVRHK